MSRIEERFDSLKASGEKALVLFVTGGDPELDQLPEILLALQEGGADLIEVGLPFSDPIADGPTIQASSQRALDRGVTPRQVLETLSKVKLDIPIVLMGYLNPILRIGPEAFAELAVAAGASGTIVSDLTPEESDNWRSVSRSHGLDNIFLVAPTSTDERIQIAADRASGFVYAVSRTGVTGAQQSAPPEVADLVKRVRAKTALPICVGFGISTPEHVRMVCEVADGAVVGSWLVDFLAKNWQNGQGQSHLIEAVRSLKGATTPTSRG